MAIGIHKSFSPRGEAEPRSVAAARPSLYRRVSQEHPKLANLTHYLLAAGGAGVAAIVLAQQSVPANTVDHGYIISHIVGGSVLGLVGLFPGFGHLVDSMQENEHKVEPKLARSLHVGYGVALSAGAGLLLTA